jgi:Icc protein
VRIQKIIEKPIGEFPYLNVGGRRHKGKILRVRFPVYKAYVDRLPEGLDALIVASDLQGNVKERDELLLLGEVFPQFLKELLEAELKNTTAASTGILLCGDLYANLEKRGGLGDVRPVWKAFREHFKWVTGVAGNHDNFGSFHEKLMFKLKEPNIHFLEKEEVQLDELKIGGVSGIVGSNNKAFRVEESDFLDYIEARLKKKPDVLLLHEGPSYREKDLRGNPEVRTLLESKKPTLVCCGHSHWRKHLIELNNGTQVLNSDAKAFVLVEKD